MRPSTSLSTSGGRAARRLDAGVARDLPAFRPPPGPHGRPLVQGAAGPAVAGRIPLPAPHTSRGWGETRLAMRARARAVRSMKPRTTAMRFRDMPQVRSYPGGFTAAALGTFPTTETAPTAE